MSDSGTVYIVEDDASVRSSLSRLLRLYGYRTVSFATAELFLKEEKRSNPCCLVLDLRLPGMSGFELQDALLARADKIPMIFITAHGDASDSAHALEKGAASFLEKPCDPEILIELVRDTLEAERRRLDIVEGD